MKIEICSYSGYRIFPGHGKRMVKTDGKTFTFLNGKCEASHMMKRNPRKITWTVLYRRKHKKGIEEEASKKRTRRTAKFQRAIVGASLSDIMAKRNMKPEVRKAQREQAVRGCKGKTKGTKSSEEGICCSFKVAKVAQKQKVAKPIQVKAPRVGGKR
ncbi:60S ribosomal protein L24 [Caerostris extrusa]|uniref:Large ribosomal subunit protein eL24 n=1 Tax=Caerostris extrusa TaxID=172846 RepID=A0AAV4Y7K7_CAEEX|nr:60S ribosomal protein L24 [Caerostris extrusa]